MLVLLASLRDVGGAEDVLMGSVRICWSVA